MKYFHVGKYTVAFELGSLFSLLQTPEFKKVTLLGFLNLLWETPEYKGRTWTFTLLNLGWIYMELTEHGFTTKSQFELWAYLFGEKLKEVRRLVSSKTVPFKGVQYEIRTVKVGWGRRKLPTWLVWRFELKYQVVSVDGTFDSLCFYPPEWAGVTHITDHEIINQAFECKKTMDAFLDEFSKVNQDKLMV